MSTRKNPTCRQAGALAAAVFLGLLAGGLAPACADQAAIVLDEGFGDWVSLSPAYADGSGDGVHPLDLGRLWIADDAENLYLRFETSGEVLLNGGNQLIIHLDTDNNAGTGQPANNIGAELQWKPGQKLGTFLSGGQLTTVYHDDVGFVALPTVSANGFECCFRRNAVPDGTHPLFTASTIKIFIKDSIGGGDWLPNPGQTLAYTFDQGGPLPADVPLTLRRQETTDLRTVSWNVLSDGLWHASHQPRFRRMIQAMAPDVVNFQEIYNHTPAQTAALIQSWFPGSTWYGAASNDCHTVSRYPILGSWPVDGNLAVHLDTTSPLGVTTLIFNVHLPCCTDDQGRQREVDHILSVLRDAKEPGGIVTVPSGTAVLFTGDTNLVGASGPRTSILTGDISDNLTWGPDFAPDWDGGALTDLVALHTHRRLAYTWRSLASAFWPGRLDYLVYNDSAVMPGTRFILDPSGMSADSLSAYGLFSTDGAGSDHLPLCVDLRGVAAAETADGGFSAGSLRWSIGPNPSRGAASFAFELPGAGRLSACIFDAAGRRVAEPFPVAFVTSRSLRLNWSGRDDAGRPLAPGTYFVRVSLERRLGRDESSRRWTVVR